MFIVSMPCYLSRRPLLSQERGKIKNGNKNIENIHPLPSNKYKFFHMISFNMQIFIKYANAAKLNCLVYTRTNEQICSELCGFRTRTPHCSLLHPQSFITATLYYNNAMLSRQTRTRNNRILDLWMPRASNHSRAQTKPQPYRQNEMHKIMVGWHDEKNWIKNGKIIKQRKNSNHKFICIAEVLCI